MKETRYRSVCYRFVDIQTDKSVASVITMCQFGYENTFKKSTVIDQQIMFILSFKYSTIKLMEANNQQ